MIIHWILPAPLAEDAGDRRTIDQEVPGEVTTLGEALHLLGRAYPKLLERITDDSGEVREHVNVFVRDELTRQGLGLRTPLESGDEVVVLHAVSGGSPDISQ